MKQYKIGSINNRIKGNPKVCGGYIKLMSICIINLLLMIQNRLLNILLRIIDLIRSDSDTC
jgi:hypothetical protein